MITTPQEKKLLWSYLIQILDKKTNPFSTIFRLNLSHNHVKENIYKCPDNNFIDMIMN